MNALKKTKRLPILGAVLVVQAALVAGLYWQQDETVATVNEPLLAIQTDNVNHLIIAGEQTVNLRKEGQRWQLANGLPVDGARVESLIQKLADLKTAWPVATSADAAERFEVTDEHYQRKISLFNGDDALATVLFGSSPGFNQAHTRIPSSDAVYALKFSIYDAPTQVDSWLDTTLMRPSGEVMAITTGEFTVAKENGAWPMVQAPDAEVADSEDDKTTAETPVAEAAETTAAADTANAKPTQGGFDAESFVKALTDLRVIGVAQNVDLDVPDKTEGKQADVATLDKIQWTLKTNEGQFEYELIRKEDQYYIRRNDYSETFRIGKSQYESLVKVNQSSLALAHE